MAGMQEIHWKNREYSAAIEAAGLDDAERIAAWSGGVRKTKRRHGWMVRDTVAGIGAVYIKWYGMAWPSVRDRIIGSRAYREWRNSVSMSEMGMGQPEFICVGTRRNWCSVSGSFLIMREIPEVKALSVWLDDEGRASDDGVMRGLAEVLVTMVETMHRGGFCHWDLKLRNILVSGNRSGLKLLPIDATNGRRIGLWNRRHCCNRDYRFLLKDPRLGPYVAAAMERLGVRR